MKFGLSFLPDADMTTKSPSEYYKEALKLCVIADQAGMHTIKMTEHYLHPYGGYCPDPLTFLASVASITQNIRLMTGCVLPVFHHPIQLASRAAMVDILSQGRLDVGFARAYLPYEFDAFGVDIDESRDRYTLAIEAIKQLWSEENVTIDSPFFKFKNATILPRPLQYPHPPIWGAAVMSRQSFAWLGEQGFNLLVTPPPGPVNNLKERIDIYRESFASQTQLRGGEVAISLPLLLDENHANAIKKSDRYLSRYLNVWVDAVQFWQGKHSSAYPGYERIPEILNKLTPHDMRNYQQAIVGTPEGVCEQIMWLHETLSIDHFLWQIDFGTQPFHVSMKTLELLIGEVMPRLGMTAYEV
jgi:alkanesulfonate monooxygenase SsuD/methylene tetrahydromethanopterin reductase-like flavin-dependent oxidoreductase (luciferase family)